MKKIISVILTVFILISVAFTLPVFAGNSVELRLTDATIYAGDEFQLKLFISDNSDLSGAVIDINYDASILEFVSAETGEILDKDATISVKNFNKDKSYVRFTYMSPSSSVTSEGILMTITFKALEDAVGETPVNIIISHAGDFVNSNLEKLSYTLKNSTVKIINTSVTETITEETSSESNTENISADVSTETTTEFNEDDSDKKDNLKIVIGLFVAGAIIIIAVVVYMVVDKKKKQRGNEE